VLGFDFKSINNHRGISQPHRFTLLNSSGNFTSPSSNTISTVSIYSGNKGRSKPSIQNTPERHQGDHSNRCIKEGLGFILPEQNNKGTMDSTVHFQTDNMSALSYLVKIGGNSKQGNGCIVALHCCIALSHPPALNTDFDLFYSLFIGKN